MTYSGLSQLLVTRKDEILSRFIAEVRRAREPGSTEAHSVIEDHIPVYLDAIAERLALDGHASSRAGDSKVDQTARQHGKQRWKLGYAIDALVREYGLLRRCILSVVKDAGVTLSVDEFDGIATYLDEGIAESTAEYARFRDGEVAKKQDNLSFLSEAGVLLASSLDSRSTLTRLTRLVVPRLADWCSIYLAELDAEQMPLAHVDPTKLELLRDIYRLHPVPDALTRGHLHVVQTGEPEFVPQADEARIARIARSDAHRQLLIEVGVRSWMILPLRVHGHTLGAITLAYGHSGRSYDEADLSLASELARRAAAAIDNTRLYELSQQARSRVEVATRAKDEFVAMVSHELRTPLNVVLGWLRLIRTGGLSDAKRVHAMDVIERNAEAQSRLVSDLLDISRIITGKVRINLSQVDLSNVVDMAVEAVRFAADAKRIKIEISLDRANSVLRADGDRLQQVVGNLLSNAVKFTPKDGHVRVKVCRAGSDLELSVEDDGEGIVSSFLPHVFESFRQEDAALSRKHGGLGLGLSISKHLVELHGGTLEASSAGAGQGAKFVVRLPISPLVSGTLGVSRIPATQHQPSAELLPSLRGVRVLVVDDERDARELIAFVLETCEVEVRQAASAEEAMRELDDFTPDVICSDIGMPNEDGYSLIRKIRTLAPEGKRNTPAIALTAFARNEDRTRALVEGFNAHLTKPIEPQELVRVVTELSAHVLR